MKKENIIRVEIYTTKIIIVLCTVPAVQEDGKNDKKGNNLLFKTRKGPEK